MIAEPSLPSGSGIDSIYAYARCRLTALSRVSAIRREVIVTVGMLVVLFALPFLSWWRRWTLPNSPQGYAPFVLPLVLAWLWVLRFRLVLPELDALNRRFTENSVLRFLLEEEPDPPRRLRWPLFSGGALTLLALLTGEPSLTCTAFLLLLAGIVGFRLGTNALRLVAFPLLLLATMLPLPGLVLDYPLQRLQSLLFKFVTHLLQVGGLQAEQTVEGNPIQIGTGTAEYDFYAAYIGTGLAEAGLFLLLLLWFLSLVTAPPRARFSAFLCGSVWITIVLVLRLTLLGWLSTADRDLMTTLVVPTLWLVPLVGIAGQWLILRGFRCLRVQEWVAFKREAEEPFEAEDVTLYAAPRRYRTVLSRLLVGTLVLGLAAEGAVALYSTARPTVLPPVRLDTWQRARTDPPKSDTQRDSPPAAYFLYTSEQQAPLYVSVAHVTTLNALRAPWHYLLGTDGMLSAGQEKPVPRQGQRLPVRMLQIAHDRQDVILILHWVQSYGEDPILYPLDTPGEIATSLLTHAPLTVCDIWMVLGPDSDADKFVALMSRLADQVDAQIKAGRRN
jgi:hypothetical protein